MKFMRAKIAHFNRIKIEIQHLKNIHDLRLKNLNDNFLFL